MARNIANTEKAALVRALQSSPVRGLKANEFFVIFPLNAANSKAADKVFRSRGFKPVTPGFGILSDYAKGPVTLQSMPPRGDEAMFTFVPTGHANKGQRGASCKPVKFTRSDGTRVSFKACGKGKGRRVAKPFAGFQIEDFYEDDRIVYRLGSYYVVEHDDGYWEGPLKVGSEREYAMRSGESHEAAVRRLAAAEKKRKGSRSKGRRAKDRRKTVVIRKHGRSGGWVGRVLLRDKPHRVNGVDYNEAHILLRVDGLIAVTLGVSRGYAVRVTNYVKVPGRYEGGYAPKDKWRAEEKLRAIAANLPTRGWQESNYVGY